MLRQKARAEPGHASCFRSGISLRCGEPTWDEMVVINVCLTSPLSHCLARPPPRYQGPGEIVFFFGLDAICYGILDVCWPTVAHLIIFVRDAPGSFSNYRKCHAIDIFHITRFGRAAHNTPSQLSCSSHSFISACSDQIAHQTQKRLPSL